MWIECLGGYRQVLEQGEQSDRFRKRGKAIKVSYITILYQIFQYAIIVTLRIYDNNVITIFMASLLLLVNGSVMSVISDDFVQQLVATHCHSSWLAAYNIVFFSSMSWPALRCITTAYYDVGKNGKKVKWFNWMKSEEPQHSAGSRLKAYVCRLHLPASFSYCCSVWVEQREALRRGTQERA